MRKNVLIIGASSGLGKELALQYATDGWKVGVLARRTSLLLELSKLFPTTLLTQQGDISSPEIDTQLQTISSAMEKIDLIIVCASVVHMDTDIGSGKEAETIAINVQGYATVLQFAWNYFIKSGKGQIVGITSIAAARGNRNAPAYCASKAFQSNYLEGLRMRAKFENNAITVTELLPGYIDTDMAKGERIFWITTASKAALLCIKAISRQRARAFIPGKWRIVFTIQRFLPIFIYDKLLNGSWKFRRSS